MAPFPKVEVKALSIRVLDPFAQNMNTRGRGGQTAVNDQSGIINVVIHRLPNKVRQIRTTSAYVKRNKFDYQ